MSTDDQQRIVLRGSAVSQDGEGRICLDDLWRIASGTQNRAPRFWRRTEPAKALIRVLGNNVRISHNKADVIFARPGRAQRGTFAHPVLAAAYAGYLDPLLEVEMREVWLRYRSGDPTLADEILQRASAEANHWVGVRALGRARRKGYTGVLKAHGVKERGYMECTEAVYIHLLGGRAYQLRSSMRLEPKANVRDHLDADDLAYVMAAEALASERIEEEDRRGNAACAEASAICATAIRRAVNDDRNTRQRRLVG
jgi:hypothetical protein